MALSLARRPARRRDIPVQPLRISLLIGVFSVFGILSLLVGVGAAVIATGQSGTPMHLPVRLAGSPTFWVQHVAPQPVQALALDNADTALYEGDGQDASAGITAGAGGLRAEVAFLDHPVDAGVALAAHSGAAVAGLSVFILVALLVPLVRTTAAREPFAPGNAARLAAAAGVLVLASIAASVLPYLGAQRLLQMPFITEKVWVADLQPVLWPLPAAVLLLVLAAAVHAGARLREDTEGLV
ncbi:hypothetical protein CLV92_1029 [Kineococcus xinjiangensis]|uniref:DUF2975 family protein n=1 Tax=Kineococcus xinjiangensis TaxID=512762 RepID=A0A2S6IUJ6_9ACTN|nr:hypothetical protein [Kineococcus xinjiangensis]PPK97859.1 hypothetical protein CLV92_1029 [Kineococcus xinjiangensis]